MEDLDEWEVLPEDGLLEIHDDHQGHHFFSRKYLSPSPSDSLFKNYFGLSSPKQLPNDDDDDQKFIVPVPIQLELPEIPIPVPAPISLDDDDAEEKKIILVGNTAETEEDLLSQQVVFFKKETEFVDMKLLDSPRSRGIKPPPQMVQFEEAPEPIKMDDEAENDEDDDEQNSGKLMSNNNNNSNNILKWSLTGIGAICSFGVATVCVLVLGGLTKNLSGTKTCNNSKQQRGQKLQFHIYAEDKRLKQVVHQANKLNEAMAAMGGVPFTRAHITFGGYCDSH